MWSQYLKVPLVTALASLCLLPQAAEAQSTNGFNRTIQVRVKFTRAIRGMVATEKAAIIGSVRSDSFDSSMPLVKSDINGQYVSALAGDNAFIGTTSKKPDDFDISGNAIVMGQIGTGAPGVLKASGSYSVGSKLWVVAGKTGLESADYLKEDLNVSFPDAQLPFTTGLTPTNGVYNGTNYTYVLANGNYVLNTLSLGSRDPVVVTGKASLWVKTSFDMGAKSFIRIEPGASLDVYVGTSLRINGGAIVNLTGKAENLSLYGLTTMTDSYINGSAAFIGTVYAPQAKVEFAGTSDFYGASICREIDLTGDFGFHYDEALSKKGQLYIPIAWKEM